LVVEGIDGLHVTPAKSTNACFGKAEIKRIAVARQTLNSVLWMLIFNLTRGFIFMIGYSCVWFSSGNA
jgi:hypothetical protein